jgi:superfamily II RNA helicase
LGLDVVGHVIHLNNIFKDTDRISYKHMMSGKPQLMSSKFKLSHNLLLNLIDIGDTNVTDFANKSMITGDIENSLKDINTTITATKSQLNVLLDKVGSFATPINVVEEYMELLKNRPGSVNKKRKDIDRRINDLLVEYKFIDAELLSYTKLFEKEKELDRYQHQYDNSTTYIQREVSAVIKLLSEYNFIEPCIQEATLKLTLKGRIASHLREVNSLVFATLIEEGSIMRLTPQQLVALFSCFTNITVNDDIKNTFSKSNCNELNTLLRTIENLYLEYQDKEHRYSISCATDYNIHYDLLEYVSDWCACTDVTECRVVLNRLEREKGIYLGEFVKALLKINNISSELEKIAETIGNIDFLSKLQQTRDLTLKYVVTNQSLYV